MSEQYGTPDEAIAASDRYESLDIPELIEELRLMEEYKPWFNKAILWHVWTYVDATHPHIRREATQV